MRYLKSVLVGFAGAILAGMLLSLENYRKLAREINCDDATDQTFRDSCKEIVQMLASDVNEADEKIKHYRELPNPQVVDLFDIHEAFHKIMSGVEALGCEHEFYGERNQQLFANKGADDNNREIGEDKDGNIYCTASDVFGVGERAARLFEEGLA